MTLSSPYRNVIPLAITNWGTLLHTHTQPQHKAALILVAGFVYWKPRCREPILNELYK